MAPSVPLPKPLSFKDKIMGRNNEGSPEESDLWVSEDDDEEDREEDDEPDYTSFRLSREEKAIIRKPWQNTLTIKLLRRNIGFNLLLRKIKEI